MTAKGLLTNEAKNSAGQCAADVKTALNDANGLGAGMQTLSANQLHLIACCSSKLSNTAPARDLYTSDLFRKSVAYAEGIGARWAVLSALHGIVLPDTVLKPYDVTLLSMTREQRRCWGEMAADQLWPFDDREFVFLAGATYRDPMTSAQIWRARGYRATAPMQGLGIGEQKAWLLANTVEKAAA